MTRRNCDVRFTPESGHHRYGPKADIAGPQMTMSGSIVVPYLSLISGYKLSWLIRFGDLIEPEIDLWGAPNDLTAIAYERCRSARLKLETKLRNYAKKTVGYATS
jgi:hypothetical protein